MTKPKEHPSATVPQAQQAEETLSRWRWVKPCAWTVRMLTTLEQGVEGGKWFRLFDKVFAERNLWAAFQQVAQNGGAPGVDHQSIQDFEKRLPDPIWELSDALKAGRFTPQAIRRVAIPKPGSTETRPLGIPTVRDRVVQAAIVNVIEPIFERDFAEHSYGFRPGRGCKDALRRVDQLLAAGYVHVVDADLKGYFDSIPHDRLMTRLEAKIADGPVLRLIESFLKADILDEASQWTPTQGAPQGAVLSPLLSNIYLDPLDHLVAEAGYEMVRYADDFVILCRTAEDAANQLWKADADGYSQQAFIRAEGHGGSGGGLGAARASKSQEQKAQKMRRRQRIRSPDFCVLVVQWEDYSSRFAHTERRRESAIVMFGSNCCASFCCVIASPSRIAPKFPYLPHPLTPRRRHPRPNPFRHRNPLTETDRP